MASKSEKQWQAYGKMRFRGIESFWNYFWETSYLSRLIALVPHEKPATLTEFVKRVIDNLEQEVRWLIEAPLTASSLEVFFRKETAIWVKTAVTCNPACPPERVMDLIRYGDADFLACFAQSPAVSKLERSAFVYFKIRKVSLKDLATNPGTPLEVLRAMACGLDEEERLTFLNNPKVSADILGSLSLRVEESAGAQILRHPNVDIPTIERLARSVHAKVRQEAARKTELSAATLAGLCVDPDPMVRAIASVQIERALGALRLTDWCTVNLGASSSRVNLHVQKMLEAHQLDAGWLVVLGNLLQRVYRSRYEEYFQTLFSIKSPAAKNNISRCAVLLLNNPHLEESLRYLSREQIVSIFEKPWAIAASKSWHNRYGSEVSYLPNMRAALGTALRGGNFLCLQDLLNAIGQVADAEAKEIAERHDPPLNVPQRIEELLASPKPAAFSKWEVVSFRNLSEIVSVGKQMKNCLRHFGNALSHAPGGLLLIRDRLRKKPLWIVSLSMEGDIRELRGNANCTAPAHIRKSIEEWISPFQGNKGLLSRL